MPGFRASARALDLLGRQQIANVPSAINELFKNAYDAYATQVEADLIRPENLLIIRDNGIGMTRSDFEDKWLVLGTDSKFNLFSSPPYRPPQMMLRPVAGEKGIGRLAIGMLGAQTLVLTRARRDDGLHKSVAAFVNWSAFAIPGVDLADIAVPLVELDQGRYFDADVVRNLVGQFRLGLKSACTGKATQGLETLVYEELDTFTLEPQHWLEELGGLDLSGSQAGACFFIQPVSGVVWDSIEPERDKRVSELVRHVLGFTDTISRKNPSGPIKLALRAHSGPGDYDDLIEESQFWTYDDFAKADHEIHGAFNGFGHFQGEVRIFDNASVSHSIPNRDSRGHKTECGPFEFHLGYVQGNLSDSSLNPVDFAAMSARLLELAGIYVYRDGLRVLPYGDQEYDWLRIEERRNKGNTYYHFSYRRMFGCVCISRIGNPDLRDKAGREGFQHTRAYSQLKDLLVGVLIQLAADFFRDRDSSTPYQQGRRENEKRQKAWSRHQASKNERLAAFRSKLRKAEELVTDGALTGLVKTELEQLDADLQVALASESPDIVVRGLLDAETKYSDRVRSLAAQLDVPRPRGIALSSTLSRSYTAISERRGKLMSEVLEPAQRQIEEAVFEAARRTKTNLDERLRVTTLVERQVADIARSARGAATASKATAQDLAVRIAQVSNEVVSKLEQRLRSIVTEVNSYDYDSADRESISFLLSDCRNQAALAAEFFTSGLIELKEVSESLIIEWDEGSGLISSLDVAESLDSDVQELSESANKDLELAQIGLSVDIINHEFLSSVNAVRKGLRALESWAQYNHDLDVVYGVLQTNFNHLENFLQLFTPLRKRFNAEKTEITGELIRDYVRSVFYERLAEAGIELSFTERFLKRRVMSYASVLLPAFVNLIDNASFWLADRPGARKIELDVDGSDWLISDNGPGIPEQYRSAIFKAGYTTKPGGRGLGLYIARQVLQNNGFELEIESAPRLSVGTTFRIRKHRDRDE